MNIFFITLIIFVVVYVLLTWFARTSTKKISRFIRILIILNSGRFNFNNFNQSVNKQSMSIDEAYRILNLRTNNKYTKDQVMKSYKSIMKKIHPDISPELTRLASIVNEAKDIVLKNLI